MKIELNKKLEELSKALQECGVYLSGSFALYYQGVDLKRDAHDIDFVYSNLKDTTEELKKILENFGCTGYNENFIGSNGDTSISVVYGFDEDKVFEDFSRDIVFLDIRSTDNLKLVEIDGIKMQECKSILEKKLEYALGSASTKQKHIDDLKKLGVNIDSYIAAKELKDDADLTFNRETGKLLNVFYKHSGQTHNFKYQVLRTGQVRAYADSVYEYEINTPLNFNDLMTKLKSTLGFRDLARITHTTKNDSAFDGTSGFLYGLNPFYKLSKIGEDTYNLKICEPYTD